MRKSTFISEVRERLSSQSPDALKRLIINIAKLVPQDSFEEVLDLFDKECKSMFDTDEENILPSVKRLCENVKNGQYDLLWGYEEGYYGRSWGDDETLYDKNGLGEELDRLLRMAMSCVIHKKYSIAVQAIRSLLDIKISNEDYEDIDILTMFDNNLLALELEDVLKHYAYAILMTTREYERVERLFDIERISNFNLKLDEIMKINGDEIPDHDKFCKQWVEFLIEHPLTRYGSILFEAIKCQGGTKALEEFVLTHGATHQKAYIDLIKTYITEEKYENAVRIIQDGFSKIPNINPNRTAISDLLVEIGQKVDNTHYLKFGLEEGFYSSIDLTHFLNLYALNDKDVLAKAVKHCDANSKQLRNNDQYYIHFLNGDYEFVWKACRDDKSYLGWSNSLKGKMVPLFMALLSGTAELKPCIRKFIEDSYFNNNFELFARILKNSLRNIPQEEYVIYFTWCIMEIEERVKAIITGQHRGSYYKASALIVAMGEVLIAQGNHHDAVTFIKGYKEKYPRHSAFHGCLKEDLKLSKIGNILERK